MFYNSLLKGQIFLYYQGVPEHETIGDKYVVVAYRLQIYNAHLGKLSIHKLTFISKTIDAKKSKGHLKSYKDHTSFFPS